MLRTLRERRWYLLLWLPLSTAFFLLAVWFWVLFHIVGGWTFQYDAAPKWGFLSTATFVVCALVIFLFFPRKPARNFKAATTSVAIVALVLGTLFYANTRLVTYEVRDVDGGPLADIFVQITHHANGVALTWFPGDAILHTDKLGRASLRIFKSEQCDAHINDTFGSVHAAVVNRDYSEDNAFLTPPQEVPQSPGAPFREHGCIEHSYMVQYEAGPPSISQRCIDVPSAAAPGLIHVYLRRNDSPSLPLYYNQIINRQPVDLDIQSSRLLSLGGSIEGFNHLDELLAAVSHDDLHQDAALYSLTLLATQISEVSRDLPELLVDPDNRLSRFSSADQQEKCSQMLYVWLSGSKAPPPLSHPDRVAYLQQRIERATGQLIEALHPALLKKRAAYNVLQELRQIARPAMKFYPEVFAKGTPEAQEGALEMITFIAPSARDIAFLLRSKNSMWIERARALTMNSTAAELSDDLKTLETLKSQESDPQIGGALDRIIRDVTGELARDQSDRSDVRVSPLEPRYVVLDLGTKMLHPRKLTNSGYVLGDGESSSYVWFEGTAVALQPKNAGDIVRADAVDESGTVTGTESAPASSGRHGITYSATWEKGANLPKLSEFPSAPAKNTKSDAPDPLRTMDLPQIPNSRVVPIAANAGVALLRAQTDPPRSAQLVTHIQVIGNGPNGSYLWEMKPTLSPAKTFKGPIPLNELLPGEPATSPWNVTSVAAINDGGAIVGTAIYEPTGPTDPIPRGTHGVLVLPLAIVRETTPGSGDFGPITDNGLDDNASIPVFTSASADTPKSEVSDPESDGQGIFYVEMAGSIPSSITLKLGDKLVAVQATPVSGRPNLLRTGKLVLISRGDPFRAPDITTIEEGQSRSAENPALELQKNGRTIVH